jgi:hypothetical protein
MMQRKMSTFETDKRILKNGNLGRKGNRFLFIENNQRLKYTTVVRPLVLLSAEVFLARPACHRQIALSSEIILMFYATNTSSTQLNTEYCIVSPTFLYRVTIPLS